MSPSEASITSPSQLLIITRDQHGDSVVVQVVGELDLSTTSLLERAVAAACTTVAGTPGMVVIDLAGLQFMSAAGIHLFLDLQVACHRQRVPLRLAAPSTAVRAVFGVADVEHQFSISPSIDDALRAVPAGGAD